MGVMLSGGASMRWLAGALAPLAGGDALPKIAALAAESPPGARGLIFLPYLSGERMPHNDPDARAALIGLSTEHTIGDIARAVMEGVAFNLREILDITRATGAAVDEMRLIGGGARSEIWPRILADVYEMPVTLLASEEGTAIGAALLAATGAGAFGSVPEAADACVRAGRVIAPRTETAAVYREQYARFLRGYGATQAVSNRPATSPD
jgi:xylulokinase